MIEVISLMQVFYFDNYLVFSIYIFLLGLIVILIVYKNQIYFNNGCDDLGGGGFSRVFDFFL